jgi:hypothetical protein
MKARSGKDKTRDDSGFEQKLLNKAEGESHQLQESDIRYIHYLPALKILSDRLSATPGELAIWVMMGRDCGGLNAYANPNAYRPIIPIHHQGYFVPDYHEFLARCWFSLDDINSFHPTERYIASEELIRRWSEHPNLHAASFIKSKIKEGELLDLHPNTGATKWSKRGLFPAEEWAMFSLDQVTHIEKECFQEGTSSRAAPVAAQISGVPAQRIIGSFSFWDGRRWKAVLSRPGSWIEDARVKPVVHRKAALWNPAEVANCLLAYRIKYWHATSSKPELLFARAIPPKRQLERIIQEDFPDWLPYWRPDLD